MTREQIIKNLEYLIQFLPSKSIYAEKTLTCAIAALRGPEWVRTVDRLPTAEDAGIDGEVAFCYRDEWDCFNRLEKWDEINPQKHTYWHKMLKAPEVEG